MSDQEAAAASPGLDGKRVLVTGGASGIGRAAAMLLARRGARVIALDVDDTAGAALAAAVTSEEHQLHYLHADVSSETEVIAAVRAAAGTLGGLDVLVHAAGIMAGQMEDIRRFTEATWDRVVDINLKGAFLVARQAASVMLDAGSGVIILVASKGGVATGSGSFAYGASKGGVHGLAMTLDRHLGPRGIRVNDVCPGDVDTPLMRRSLAEGLANGADPVAIEKVRSGLTTPESIAELLAFLASDAAACVRGTLFTA